MAESAGVQRRADKGPGFLEVMTNGEGLPYNI